MAKRYQRGNQKSPIEEGQTTQWPKDKKGIIRSRQSKKDRQHNGLVIVLSVVLRLTTFDYSFGIFWPLCCLSFFDWRLLITPLVSFDHCVVCPSSIDDFWLPLWYLLAIVLSVLLRLTTFDYPFGIFWPLCCLSFFDWRLPITPLVSFDHCVVCPSSIDDFFLPLWCYLTFYI
jgi:hypothetical protein